MVLKYSYTKVLVLLKLFEFLFLLLLRKKITDSATKLIFIHLRPFRIMLI